MVLVSARDTHNSFVGQFGKCVIWGSSCNDASQTHVKERRMEGRRWKIKRWCDTFQIPVSSDFFYVLAVSRLEAGTGWVMRRRTNARHNWGHPWWRSKATVYMSCSDTCKNACALLRIEWVGLCGGVSRRRWRRNSPLTFPISWTPANRVEVNQFRMKRYVFGRLISRVHGRRACSLEASEAFPEGKSVWLAMEGSAETSFATRVGLARMHPQCGIVICVDSDCWHSWSDRVCFWPPNWSYSSYVNCVDDWFHHLLTDAHLFWGCWIPLLFVRWGMGDITNSFGTLKIKTSDSHHFRCLILWVNRYQMFVDPLGVTGFVARRVISLFQQFALSVMNYSRYRIQHEFMNVNRLP